MDEHDARRRVDGYHFGNILVPSFCGEFTFECPKIFRPTNIDPGGGGEACAAHNSATPNFHLSHTATRATNETHNFAKSHKNNYHTRKNQSSVLIAIKLGSANATNRLKSKYFLIETKFSRTIFQKNNRTQKTNRSST